MKLTVFNSDGTTSREQDFAGIPSFEGDKGTQALKEVIVAINANNRQGTHSTKTRGEVRGGGKKPWRQFAIRFFNLFFRRVLGYTQYFVKVFFGHRFLLLFEQERRESDFLRNTLTRRLGLKPLNERLSLF